MRVWRGLKVSVRAVLAQKARTTFAIASMGVGVAAVTVTGAIGAGAENAVVRRMEALGTNLLIVRPAQVRRSAARPELRGVVSSLRLEDYEDITRLSGVALAAPGIDGAARIKSGSGAVMASVLGTGPSFAEVRRFRVASGRFLVPDDDHASSRVAVLGARVADTLFPRSSALGQQVRIRGVPFTIVGTLAAKGASIDGGNEDNQVLIPVRTAMRRVFNVTWLSTVFVSASDPARMEETADDITGLLRTRHRQEGTDDFAVQNTARTVAVQRQTAEALNMLTTGISALTLLVGGSGVLTLMFMTVRERTTEIGLRMAVGARPSDILSQFLTEASLLAMIGWIAGVLVGVAATVGLALTTEWPIDLPTTSLLTSFGMVVVTGVVFGVLPARKASLIPPILALGRA